MKQSIKMKNAALACGLAIFLVACGGRPVPLKPQVRVGPANGANPNRVLALPATCGSVEFTCPPSYISTVNSIVRSSMDFAGYALVESEQLRRDTRDREETHETEVVTHSSQSTAEVERTLDFDDKSSRSESSRTERRRSVVQLDGSNFEDLSVVERQEVLAQVGADGVLVARIVVGAQQSEWIPNQHIEVMVKLSVDSGRTMVWAARCMASSNDFSTVESALENATRCAVYGATGN